MKEPIDWKAEVPPILLDVVVHIRERFDHVCWNIDRTTERFCYAALHPDNAFEHRDQHAEILARIKAGVSLKERMEFGQLVKEGTPPAIFAAYHGLRKQVSGRLTLGTFEELHKLGRAQRESLPSHPALWAQNQTSALIQGLDSLTRSWLKRVCDQQPLNGDVDELIWWRQWRAPRLLVMKPSRFADPDPERYWERADAETTERWLGRFAEDVILPVELAVQRLIGEAKLQEAMSSPSEMALPSKPIGVSPLHDRAPSNLDKPFDHSPDYRSLSFKGQDYRVTARQATMIRILHEALTNRLPDVSQARLLAAVESETSQVRHIFKGSPLWGTLIQSLRRGLYRLVP